MIPFLALGFGSVFVASVSQVLLKKAALRPARDLLHEYLNARVIAAYALFFGSTLLTVYAYRGVPLSMGPMFEATSYVYVTLFGALFFGEKLTRRKLLALALILAGIVCFAL